MWLVGLIVVGLALGLLGVILQGVGGMMERKSVKNGFEPFLQQQNINRYEYEYTAGNEYIIHDKTHDMFWVYDGGHVGRQYGSITNVELVIDDTVAYKRSMSSTVGRAVVGGVLAGGVGAIIGGITGKQNGKKIVHRVELILSFSTPQNPYRKVTFLNEEQGVDIYSDTYKRAEQSGLYWSNLISSYMR